MFAHQPSSKLVGLSRSLVRFLSNCTVIGVMVLAMASLSSVVVPRFNAEALVLLLSDPLSKKPGKPKPSTPCAAPGLLVAVEGLSSTRSDVRGVVSVPSTNRGGGAAATTVLSSGANTLGDEAELGADVGLLTVLGGVENVGEPVVVDPGPVTGVVTGPVTGPVTGGATASCTSFSPTVSV